MFVFYASVWLVQAGCKGWGKRIPILRVKCTRCRKTHAVLPEFLSPHKHYSQVARQMFQLRGF